jgi:hypothetical protein
MAQALPERHRRCAGQFGRNGTPQPNDKHRRGDSLKSFSKLKKGLFPECSFSQSALSRPWEDHESTCESMTLKRCRFLEKIMRNDKMSETMSDSSLKRSGSRLDQ